MAKKTRDAERTRAHILEKAFGLIFSRGFQGVSVGDIVEAAGMTKGAFFHHFATKDDLGHAVVDEILTELVQSRWVRPLESFEDPIEGILAQLGRIIDGTPEEQLALGCPLNNLVQEMSPVDRTFRKKLQAVLTMWIDGVESHLERARRGGYLSKKANVRQLAEFVVMTHEGAYGMSKSLRDKKVFERAHRSLASYLETLRT